MKRAFVSLVAGLAAATTVLSSSPAESATPTSPMPVKVVGMSAPSNLWNQRITEVGACGVEARRVFASLQSDGKAQSTIIKQAVSAGMMPVISYKVGNVDTLISGGYDAWLTATRNYLDSLNVQVTATFWHEPHGDMDARRLPRRIAEVPDPDEGARHRGRPDPERLAAGPTGRHLRQLHQPEPARASGTSSPSTPTRTAPRLRPAS